MLNLGLAAGLLQTEKMRSRAYDGGADLLMTCYQQFAPLAIWSTSRRRDDARIKIHPAKTQLHA